LRTSGDQALKARTAGRYEQSHGGYQHDTQLRFHFVLQEVAGIPSASPCSDRQAGIATLVGTAICQIPVRAM
jgi:hypothetical protein